MLRFHRLCHHCESQHWKTLNARYEDSFPSKLAHLAVQSQLNAQLSLSTSSFTEDLRHRSDIDSSFEQLIERLNAELDLQELLSLHEIFAGSLETLLIAATDPALGDGIFWKLPLHQLPITAARQLLLVVQEIS